MKLSNDKEVSEYKNHILMAGVRGAAAGGLVSGALWQFWGRRQAFLTAGFVRTLTLAAPVLLFGITNMEIAGRDFEIQNNYSETSELAARRAQATEEAATVSKWFSDNKYKVVAGGWAASMVGSFLIVNRDKYMTKSQKIVQARVYAQGLTVVMLLATVLLSAGKQSTRKVTPEQQADSWKGDLKFLKEEQK